jgi:hypothetical protein
MTEKSIYGQTLVIGLRAGKPFGPGPGVEASFQDHPPDPFDETGLFTLTGTHIRGHFAKIHQSVQRGFLYPFVLDQYFENLSHSCLRLDQVL